MDPGLSVTNRAVSMDSHYLECAILMTTVN